MKKSYKLSFSIAERVRRLYEKDDYTFAELAAIFSMSPANVHSIVHYKTWQSRIRLRSQEQIDKTINSRKWYKHSAETKRNIARALTGKVRSKSHCANLYKALRGTREGKNNPFYGKRHPDWLLKQIGSKIKGRVSTFKGKHHTKANRLAASTRMIERLQNGFLPFTRSKYVKGDIHIWMRSSWEVAFAEWMDKKKLFWEYEPDGFRTKLGSYLPDFFVHEWHSFVEIKGAKIKSATRKLQAFKKEYPQFKLLILDRAGLRKLGVNL